MTEEKLTQAENTISGIYKYYDDDISKTNPTGNCNHVYDPETEEKLNIAAKELKKPLAKRCPCCGLHLQRTEGNSTVFPICLRTLDCNGYATEFMLSWKCRDCGFEWRHGRFE